MRNYAPANTMYTLTLRCKAIRARILGVGEGWSCLGGVWCVGWVRSHLFPDFLEPRLQLALALLTPPKPHPTTPNPTKHIFARASPETNLRAMRRMVMCTQALP